MRRRFLFYLGALHAQGAPELRAYLQQRGDYAWLIDGTLEPGTAVFFGGLEIPEQMLLACAKIPTENAAEVAECLRQARQGFGGPASVGRDLSGVLEAACRQALPEVPQKVCHAHLARDVGEDLYREPQAALSRRLQTLKLAARWKEQRRGQSEPLRRQLEAQGSSSAC
jgi:hypothetical protein